MLTVMYRDEKGSESLFEAQSVQRINRHLPCPAGDTEPGVIIQFEPSTNGTNTMHLGETQACGGDDVPREVFVMNRFGATVATYRL